MLRSLFVLALAGLAISAPTVTPDTNFELAIAAATSSDPDKAAAFGPSGLQFSIDTDNPDAPISIIREAEVMTLANTRNVKGGIWCETSNASPKTGDVLYLAAAFNDGAQFAAEFHGCTQLYYPFYTAAMGFCGDMWPGHGLTGAIAQDLVRLIGELCSVNGKSGGRAEMIENPLGNLLVYHS